MQIAFEAPGLHLVTQMQDQRLDPEDRGVGRVRVGGTHLGVWVRFTLRRLGRLEWQLQRAVEGERRSPSQTPLMEHIVQIRVGFPPDMEVMVELVDIGDDQQEPRFQDLRVFAQPGIVAR